jgi:hypothetical protein
MLRHNGKENPDVLGLPELTQGEDRYVHVAVLEVYGRAVTSGPDWSTKL